MYEQLIDQPRLLFQAELAPVQGSRFQPTGFPDLGPAEFPTPGNTTNVLVESAQSMANRLENVCWDEAGDQPVEPLKDLPYVKVQAKHGSTNSILEAHRLNAPDIIDKLEGELIEACGCDGKGHPDKTRLAKYLLKRDPNSLLHGVFFPKVDGRLRLPRILSGFVEAEEVQQAASGGVKLDRLDPQGGSKEGRGHVPFHRMEYTAKRILAYFNLDLQLLRSLGLGRAAEEFLIALSLFKIRTFLHQALRLRTACDLRVVSEVATQPTDFVLPSLEQVKTDVTSTLAAAKEAGLFSDPPVLELA